MVFLNDTDNDTAGELVFPAYGGPWFEEDAAVQPDSGLCEDPGCTSADYGGPPEP